MTRFYRCAALVAAMLAVLTLACGCQRTPHFSTDLWLKEPEERTAIVDELLETHELKGMTKADILVLLGTPDNEAGYFVEDNRFVYWLGPERGWMSIDSEWLLIDFENDVVVEYAIRRD